MYLFTRFRDYISFICALFGDVLLLFFREKTISGNAAVKNIHDDNTSNLTQQIFYFEKKLVKSNSKSISRKI